MVVFATVENRVTKNAAVWRPRLQRTAPFGHVTCKDVGKRLRIKPDGCDDKNPCTADPCVTARGCVNQPLDQGAKCGAAATCQLGVCK